MNTTPLAPPLAPGSSHAAKELTKLLAQRFMDSGGDVPLLFACTIAMLVEDFPVAGLVALQAIDSFVMQVEANEANTS